MDSRATSKDKKVLREGWYWSLDGEVFEIADGAFKTPDDAVNFLNANKGFKKRSIYLMYGKEIDLKIADYLGNIVDLVNIQLDNDVGVNRFGFRCSFNEEQSLDKAVKDIAEKWQKDNNIKVFYVKFTLDTKRKIQLENCMMS